VYSNVSFLTIPLCKRLANDNLETIAQIKVPIETNSEKIWALKSVKLIVN
jgi:hypothetical protein